MDRRREGLPHNLKEGPKPKYVKLVMLTTVQSNPIQSNPLDTTRSIQSYDTTTTSTLEKFYLYFLN